ncbi:hypothetical protein [Jhaorihella thermophila]|uniref:DUF2946 domain-containing protein n=2 Tax=Jhaorihella thermophila TaxID=488547 RepID=A0A1H5Y1W7_9RHOB|nr:hypothetical protein [Jhaorihella thermophila]SEG17923.1 hypothetical protein SAMN05421751_11414 [Jhaorihella thermophila]
MRPSFRIHFALALALLLVVTGQALAMARGNAGAAGQIVLCTGTGPVIVFVDEDGQPIQPPHYCPDFALHLIGDAMLPPETAVPAQLRPAPMPPEPARFAVPRPLPAPNARGPPRPV